MQEARSILSRRSALKTVALGAGLLTLPLLEGCPVNSGPWIDQAIAELPTVIQLLANVTGVLQSAGIAGLDSGLVETISTDLYTLSNSLNSYKDGASPSVLATIISVLNELETLVPQILTSYSITDSTTSIVVATGIGLLAAAVSAVQTLLPVEAAVAVSRKTTRQQVASQLKSKPVPVSADQIRRLFNPVATLYGFGQYQL